MHTSLDIRIGLDTGGTYTDAVALDGEGHVVATAKALTTHWDLSIGLGNVQGLGYLSEQGYRVPADKVTFVLGLNSIANAVFGGHTAQVSRNGIPIMASPEAGPIQGRYWASVLVSVGMLVIALGLAIGSPLVPLVFTAEFVVIFGVTQILLALRVRPVDARGCRGGGSPLSPVGRAIPRAGLPRDRMHADGAGGGRCCRHTGHRCRGDLERRRRL